MNEKQTIERATAEGFLELFNSGFGQDYRIVALGEAPDVRCSNSDGTKLNLEITQTEDRSGDIPALLGRSQAHSLETLTARLAAGGDQVMGVCFEGEVLDNLVDRIQDKMQKAYGPNAALVVRDVSPLDWDWSETVEEIRRRLDLTSSPFDRGIWILYKRNTALIRIDHD